MIKPFLDHLSYCNSRTEQKPDNAFAACAVFSGDAVKKKQCVCACECIRNFLFQRKRKIMGSNRCIEATHLLYAHVLKIRSISPAENYNLYEQTIEYEHPKLTCCIL